MTEGLGSEDFPGFPADACPQELPDLSQHHSALADALRQNPRLYADLRDRRTSRGVGLARCIKAGVDNRGHPMVKTMGAIAGDAECYETFRELLDAVMERHVFDGDAIPEHVPGQPGKQKLTVESIDSTGKYVISTEVRVSRCFKGVRFPPAMSQEEFHEVERLVARSLVRLPDSFAGEYQPLPGSYSYAPRPGGMDRKEEAVLNSRGLLFQAPDSTLRLCTGAGRYWPEGRGVFTNHKKTLCVWVNEQEHLRVAARRPGDGLQSACKDVAEFLECIAPGSGNAHAQDQIFAYSDRLGYLTSNPANLGPAMQAVVVLRLPLLANRSGDNGDRPGHATGPDWHSWCSNQRIQLRNACSQDGVQSTDLFELSNRDRLGWAEEHILSVLTKVASCLIQMEHRLEAGHPIDDLLARNLELPTAAPRAGPKSTAQKACATLLWGLGDTRLNEALPIRRAAEAGQGHTSDPATAAAEVLFDGLLSSVVRDMKPAAGNEEAEEVRSTTRPNSKPEDDSRPATGASMWTVQPSSEGDVHDAHAQDLVALLIDSQLEDAAVKAPDITLKSKAAAVLVAATGDGTLEQALLDVKAEVDMDNLRAKACDLMLHACDNGTLEQALLGQAKVEMLRQEQSKNKSPPDISELRKKACGLLMKTTDDGTLEKVLAEVKAEVHHQHNPEDAAAVKVQSIHRGRMARARTAKMKEECAPTPPVEELRERAAAGFMALVESGGLMQHMEAALGQPNDASGAGSAGDLPQPRPEAKDGNAAKLQPQETKLAFKPSQDVAASRRAMSLLFESVSSRDRRIGELSALIRETEVRVVQQEENCKQYEDLVSAAKHDLAHLELDIEWHHHALEGAEQRSVELEAGQKKLILELDHKHHELRHHDLDALPAYSARSDLSTATGGTVASSMRSVLTPRHPIGAVLQPLAR